MCFAPQRRALFWHVNFQKWSDVGVLCTFWLGNALRATTAYTLSTSQLPRVVREWCVLYILTWKCASHHNAVQFFISSGQLAPHPPLYRGYFSTLRNPKSLEKHSESRLSYLFAHLHLLASHSLSSLIFSLLDFSSLTLPTSAFPSLHIVGSLTSKLPSINDGFLKWGYPKIIVVLIGFHKSRHPPKWMVYKGNFYLEMDDDCVDI